MMADPTDEVMPDIVAAGGDPLDVDTTTAIKKDADATTTTVYKLSPQDDEATGLVTGGDTLAPPPLPPPPVDTTSVVVGGGRSLNKKRGRPGNQQSPLDAVLTAALVQSSQFAQTQGWHGLANLLAAGPPTAAASGSGGGGSSTTINTTNISSVLPLPAQVIVAAQKALTEQPPWIHWNRMDMAPQLKILDPESRLHLSGALRGYRMARASMGCSPPLPPPPSNSTENNNSSSNSSNNSLSAYYYEVWVQPGPSAHEIWQNLPSNARLGPGLQQQLRAALEWEEEQQQQHKNNINNNSNHDQALDAQDRPQVGGHVRIGWSMRTGDLQAPVGYDKWSYGIRDIGGSILHQSQRQDQWGGEGFGPGDVIGCAIVLGSDPHDTSNNHIRFLKNGDCMGQFVMSKGKRSGGEAFDHVEPGTYYPAVSSYMGGSVRANFGPYFVYQPRKLPAGLKLAPMSDLCPVPVTPELAAAKSQSLLKQFRKVEHQQALKEAIQAEASVLLDAYHKFMKNHIANIRQERLDRGLAIGDLPE